MTSVESQSQNAALLLQMINSYRITQVIYVAAELGIADLLADGPKTSGELAEASGSHAPSLYRVLRMLASLGLFAEDEQGRFALTPLAELLQSGDPNSLRTTAIFNGAPYFWSAFGKLLHSVKTGETAADHLFGMRSWEYRAQNPEINAMFNDFMTNLSKKDIPAIVKAYDFSGIEVLVDIAGGQGSLIAAILKAYPTMRGILFDQPHVLTGAPAVLEAAGVKERCELVSGDFFEVLPAGGDAYLFKWILHDWEDERAIAILKTCRKAIKPNGKLLVVESVIPPGNTPHRGKSGDLTMLVVEGGRERTEDEFRALFSQGGFTLARIFPTESGQSMIEGVPA